MKYLLLTLLLATGLAQANTYKCLDAGGETVYSSAPCGDNAQVVHFVDDRAVSDGRLVLQLDERHSYRTPGTVNGAPVTFVVDTGASGTVISQEVAAAAGIRSCSTVGYAGTANGVVPRCTATVDEITFGEFHVKHLVVAIMPNMPVDALLGMDVLGRLKIQQQDGTLSITGK
jgi:clan AA aspartic protease (TIGR02281 family)